MLQIAITGVALWILLGGSPAQIPFLHQLRWYWWAVAVLIMLVILVFLLGTQIGRKGVWYGIVFLKRRTRDFWTQLKKENAWIIPVWIVCGVAVVKCIHIYFTFYPEPPAAGWDWDTLREALGQTYSTKNLRYGLWGWIALSAPIVMPGFTWWALSDDWERVKQDAGARGRSILALITGTTQPQQLTQPGAPGAPLTVGRYFWIEVALGLIPQIIHDIRS